MSLPPSDCRRRLRFSLRSVFLVTAIVAVVCAIAAYRIKERRDRIAQEDFLVTLHVLEILNDGEFGIECGKILRGNSGGWAADYIESHEEVLVRTNGMTLDNLTKILEEELLAWLTSAEITGTNGNHRQPLEGSIAFEYRGAKCEIKYAVTQEDSYEGFDAIVSVNVDMYR